MSNTKDPEYRITRKGQVTLPKAVRQHLGVREGEAVRFEIEEDGGVVVKKSAPRPGRDPVEIRRALEDFGRALNLRGMTPEDYMDWVRGRP